MKFYFSLFIFTLFICAFSLNCPPKAEASHSFSPAKTSFSQENFHRLKLPSGFVITVFASNICGARMIKISNNGIVFISCPQEGKIVALKDTTGDGKADVIQNAIEGLPEVHGIAILSDTIFLAAPTMIWKARIDGYKIVNPVVIIKDLPQGGRHPRRTLGVGPDKLLYISIGSSCNACIEKDSNYATIDRANLDGTKRVIFARGLRNTLGFDWSPETGQLWGLDQGSDERGDTIPPEELNLLAYGKNYGWPFVYGKRCPDPILKLPSGSNEQQFIMSTESAVLTYPAHSSPIGFVFYKGARFPQYYRNGAFVTLRGSWNRTPPSGYKVVFVKYDNGHPVGFEDFVTGFLSSDKTSQFARVTGITVANDGSVLFCDDENGMVYRIDYKK